MSYTFQDKAALQAFIQAELLTKEQALAITKQSPAAFMQAVSYERIPTFYHAGAGKKGPSNIRLFWREDIETYALRLHAKKHRSND
ncbi:hypothetical protein [Listeria seeligeri]|uniref:hypothetical protein n=1 Tax=Listeria seeligeri TaxID=1640 RepID=UPI001628BF95|nr:hypothetical protein [Listeria seeligeri]MBC1817171.1 hypothetical protein [Listeria seeligeri]